MERIAAKNPPIIDTLPHSLPAHCWLNNPGFAFSFSAVKLWIIAKLCWCCWISPRISANDESCSPLTLLPPVWEQCWQRAPLCQTKLKHAVMGSTDLVWGYYVPPVISFCWGAALLDKSQLCNHDLVLVVTLISSKLCQHFCTYKSEKVAVCSKTFKMFDANTDY